VGASTAQPRKGRASRIAAASCAPCMAESLERIGRVFQASGSRAALRFARAFSGERVIQRAFTNGMPSRWLCRSQLNACIMYIKSCRHKAQQGNGREKVRDELSSPTILNHSFPASAWFHCARLLGATRSRYVCRSD